jgi:bacterioferritin
MGELGRRTLDVDADALVRELVRAYADEWFAHYNFRFVATALRGHRAPSVVRWLRRRSDAALARADRLARRIGEVGGVAPERLGALEAVASDKPFKLPPSLGDVRGVLRAVLDAERTSLRSYDGLARLTSGGDPLTHALAVRLLAAAVRAEDAIERLIDDAAPGMDGR